MTHNVIFLVSLSNGETLYEGRGILAEIPGGKSAWALLTDYLISKKLEITSMSLSAPHGRRFNLPSAGNKPNFPWFKDIERPLDFNCFRAMTDSHRGGETQTFLYSVIEAIYPKYRLQMWVDDNNPDNCWSVVREN